MRPTSLSPISPRIWGARNPFGGGGTGRAVALGAHGNSGDAPSPADPLPAAGSGTAPGASGGTPGRLRDPKRRLADIRIALDDNVDRLRMSLAHLREVRRQEWVNLTVRLEHKKSPGPGSARGSGMWKIWVKPSGQPGKDKTEQGKNRLRSATALSDSLESACGPQPRLQHHTAAAGWRHPPSCRRVHRWAGGRYPPRLRKSARKNNRYTSEDDSISPKAMSGPPFYGRRMSTCFYGIRGCRRNSKRRWKSWRRSSAGWRRAR